MSTFRALIATTLIGVAIVTTSLALTKSQSEALNKCIGRFLDDVTNCLRDHPSLSLQECQQAAYKGYQICKKAAGIPLTQYPPPKVKRNGLRVEPVNPGVTASPSGGKAGKGQVWVNTETHVDYKEGSRFYGKTKKGEYVSEAEAIKGGNKPAKDQ